MMDRRLLFGIAVCCVVEVVVVPANQLQLLF